MQKIVLFIETPRLPYDFPSNIGNLFMNRFAIDEEANYEILKIFKLEYSYVDFHIGNLDRPQFRQRYKKMTGNDIEKGMGLMLKTYNSEFYFLPLYVRQRKIRLSYSI